MWPRPTIERAFELARSGTCRSIAEIRSELLKEGCEDVDLHLAGRLTREQLLDACAEAEAQQPDEPLPANPG